MYWVAPRHRIFLFKIFWIVLILWQFLPAQETLPPYHWSQTYLNYLKVRGLLPGLNYQMRPFTRLAIAQNLLKIDWYQFQLTAEEKQQIQLLFQEFAEEIALLIQANPEKWEYRLARAQQFISIFIPEIDSPVNITPGIFQRAGWKTYGNTRNPIATHLRLKASWANRLTLYHNMRLFNEADSNYPGKEFRKFYAFSEQAFFTMNYQWFQFKFGRDYFQVGPGRSGQLLFSDNSLPFDHYLGQLGKEKLRFYFWGIALNPRPNPLDNRNVQPRASRFINGHRLAIQFHPYLTVGVNEVILYGGPFQSWEGALMNPFMVYYGYLVNTPGFAGNAFVSLDATWYPLPGVEIYGEFLVDDFQVDKKEPGDLEPNELGLLVGGQWSAPAGMANSLLRFEYVQVRNRTYNAPVLDWEKYLHYNKVIGYYLGNNFERYQLGMDYWLQGNWQLSGDVVFIRQGEGSVQGEFNTDYLNYTVEEGYSEPFPYGIIETQWQWQFNSQWTLRPWAHVAVQVQYLQYRNYQHIPGNNHNEWRLAFSAWLQWQKPFWRF